VLDFEASLGTGPGEAARFFFNDLAQANSAAGADVVRARGLSPAETPRCSSDAGTLHGLLVGVQSVAKRRGRDYKDGPQGDLVLIHLASLRFPERGTDLLISLNTSFEAHGGRGGDRARGFGARRGPWPCGAAVPAHPGDVRGAGLEPSGWIVALSNGSWGGAPFFRRQIARPDRAEWIKNSSSLL